MSGEETDKALSRANSWSGWNEAVTFPMQEIGIKRVDKDQIVNVRGLKS